MFDIAGAHGRARAGNDDDGGLAATVVVWRNERGTFRREVRQARFVVLADAFGAAVCFTVSASDAAHADQASLASAAMRK